MGRLRQLPTARATVAFLHQLRSPRRLSALRAVLDGTVVALTLKKRGARPLFGAIHTQGRILDADGAKAVSAAVDAGLGMLPVAPTCLRRSVTLLRELDRLRLDATLHVGVRERSGGVEAHAWVQVGEVVVNDDPELTATYAELAAGDVERLLPLLV